MNWRSPDGLVRIAPRANPGSFSPDQAMVIMSGVSTAGWLSAPAEPLLHFYPGGAAVSMACGIVMGNTERASAREVLRAGKCRDCQEYVARER